MEQSQSEHSGKKPGNLHLTSSAHGRNCTKTDKINFEPATLVSRESLLMKLKGLPYSKTKFINDGEYSVRYNTHFSITKFTKRFS